MIFLRKTTMLLVILTTAMLAQPAGLHLDFCFGEDGHFDFSMNTCPDNGPQDMPSQRLAHTEAGHHGECLDMTLACSPIQEFVRTDIKADADKSAPEKDHPGTLDFLTASLAASSGLYPSGSVRRIHIRPSPQLTSLRTVVLII